MLASSFSKFSRSDCVSLLKKCLIANPEDVSKNAEKICIALMPNPDQSDCVTSLKYVEPAKRNSQQLGDGFDIFHSANCLFGSCTLRFFM